MIFKKGGKKRGKRKESKRGEKKDVIIVEFRHSKDLWSVSRHQ